MRTHRYELLMLVTLAAASARADDPRGLPARLADTGLYAGDGSLNPDVVPFSPQYPLWSDGATKRRWIYLPPGSAVDASQPDSWEFPRGTKLWKEFSQGRAIETRYIERGADGAWRYGSYVWSADGREAKLAPPAGLRDVPAPTAPGARYSIPAENDCRVCHEGAAVPVLGFSALQLSPDRDPLAPHAEVGVSVNLRTLTDRGSLRGLPPALLVAPPRIAATTPTARAALGYLHGNCGHCHNGDGPLAVLEMTLAQRVASPPAPDAVLESIVEIRSGFQPPGAPTAAPRIAPGHEATSVIALRMASRDPLQQMPPLGTAVIDAEALRLVGRWIENLSTHH